MRHRACYPLHWWPAALWHCRHHRVYHHGQGHRPRHHRPWRQGPCGCQPSLTSAARHQRAQRIEARRQAPTGPWRLVACSTWRRTIIVTAAPSLTRQRRRLRARRPRAPRRITAPSTLAHSRLYSSSFQACRSPSLTDAADIKRRCTVVSTLLLSVQSILSPLPPTRTHEPVPTAGAPRSSITAIPILCHIASTSEACPPGRRGLRRSSSGRPGLETQQPLA